MQVKVLFRHLSNVQKPALLVTSPLRPPQPGLLRPVHSASVPSGGTAAVSGFASSGVFSSSARWSAAAAAATALLGGAVTYLQQPARLDGLRVPASADEELSTKQYPEWARQLASSDAEISVLTSDTLLSEGHPLLKRDHMVCSQSTTAL